MDNHSTRRSFSLFPSFRRCRCVSDVIGSATVITGNPLYASAHEPTIKPRGSATPKNGEPESNISSTMEGRRCPPATPILPLSAYIKGRAKIDRSTISKSRTSSSNSGLFSSEEGEEDDDDDAEGAEIAVTSDSFSILSSNSLDSSLRKVSESHQRNMGSRPDEKSPSSIDGITGTCSENGETPLLPLIVHLRGGAVINQYTISKSSSSSKGGWFSSEEEERKEAGPGVKSDSVSSLSSTFSVSSLRKISDSVIVSPPLKQSPSSIEICRESGESKAKSQSETAGAEGEPGKPRRKIDCSCNQPESAVGIVSTGLHPSEESSRPIQFPGEHGESKAKSHRETSRASRETGKARRTTKNDSGSARRKTAEKGLTISESPTGPGDYRKTGKPRRRKENGSARQKTGEDGRKISISPVCPHPSEKSPSLIDSTAQFSRENGETKAKSHRETGKPPGRKENNSGSAGQKTGEVRRSSETQQFPAVMDGRVGETYAVVKDSSDPYRDFRASMVEMIVEKEIYEAEGLEMLLQCFLSLNSPHHHRVILQVFIEICEALLEVDY